MNGKHDLVTIGSCTLDCIVQVKDILRFELFDREIIKKYTAIEYSRKLNMEGVRFVPGGSGANIAGNCSMLGLNSAYIGVLGDDFSAQICLDDLSKRGVDLTHVKTTQEDNTAFSMILKTDWGRDRSILAYKGANNLLTPDDVEEDLFNDLKAFAWTSLTTENGCRAIDKAINLTKDGGGLIFAAPSMSIIHWAKDWATKLISKSDVVSINAEEAQEFTGESEKFYAIQKILDLGPKIVSITDGANGSLLSDGQKLIKSGIFKINVIDTTGAGDAFLSGLLISKLNNYPFEKMSQIASAMSAMECMEVGVRVGLPNNISELESFINSNTLDQVISDVEILKA